MALQRLRNDPEADWELRNWSPLWGPDLVGASRLYCATLCEDGNVVHTPVGRTPTSAVVSFLWNAPPAAARRDDGQGATIPQECPGERGWTRH